MTDDARLLDGHDARLLDGHGSIDVESARRIVAAVIAAAHARGWTVAVAVTDAAGDLVLFERIDDTQPASSQIAVDKARTAARFRRSTKIFDDSVTAGRHQLLGLSAIVPFDGGIPLMIGQRVVGALGISGAPTSADDGVCSQTGVDALAQLTGRRS